MSSNAGPGWIGEAPSRPDIAVVLWMGIVAVLMMGLQPLMLGALAHAGRLSASQIGFAATVELLAVGASAGLAAAVLKPRRLRLIGAGAALAHAAATLATAYSSGAGIVLSRGVAGLAAGVLLWITIGLITRSLRPERWSGVFLTTQTLTQLAFAAVLPITVLPAFGVDGAFICLAVVSGLTALVALTGPSAFGELPKPEVAAAGAPASGALGPRALAGLASIFLYMAFIVAVWVYLEPLGLQAGLSPKLAGLAVAAALAAQVMGGLAATLLGRRIPFFAVLLGAGAVNLALLAGLAAAPPPALFVAYAVVFGFLWLFVMPFQVLLLIEIDPSRRAAMQLAAAQLLGSSAGPLIAAFVVSDANLQGALAVGAVCIVLSLLLVAALHLRRSRPLATADG